MTIHEKAAKGKSFIHQAAKERWAGEAMGQFVSPIIVKTGHCLPEPLGRKRRGVCEIAYKMQPTVKEVEDKLALIRTNIANLEVSKDWDDDLEFKAKMILDYHKMLRKGEQWLLENKKEKPLISAGNVVETYFGWAAHITLVDESVFKFGQGIYCLRLSDQVPFCIGPNDVIIPDEIKIPL